MGFYDLTKEERAQKVKQIHLELLSSLKKNNLKSLQYFSDEDTYIRKAVYQSIGKIFSQSIELREQIVSFLKESLLHKKESVRQTTINAAGEIGMKYLK